MKKAPSGFPCFYSIRIMGFKLTPEGHRLSMEKLQSALPCQFCGLRVIFGAVTFKEPVTLVGIDVERGLEASSPHIRFHGLDSIQRFEFIHIREVPDNLRFDLCKVWVIYTIEQNHFTNVFWECACQLQCPGRAHREADQR